MSTQSEPDAADSGRGRPDPGLDAIMSERRQLINLAYRLLGYLPSGPAGGRAALRPTRPTGSPWMSR
jgi:hypothetical protein